MRISALFRNKARPTFGALAFLVILTSIALPAFAPFMTTQVSAAPGHSKADMLIGGFHSIANGDYRNIDQPHWAMMSCMGSITRMALTDELIQRATRISDFSGLLRENEQSAVRTMFGAWTLPAGVSLSTDTGRNYYRYLKANHNRDVQVVSWHKFSPSSPGSTASCGSDNPQGGHFILLPVHSRDGSTNPDSADTWIACQMWSNENARTNNAVSGCQATRYTGRAIAGLNQANDTIGRAEYYKTSISGANLGLSVGVVDDNFIISGLSKPGGPVVSGNISSGTFIDAATIEVKSTVNGKTTTETYVDPAWDGRRFYFLTHSTDSETRNQLTYEAKGGTAFDDPIANTASRKQIPFIYIGGATPNISFTSTTAMANFGSGINSPLTNSIQYYDYTPSEGAVCSGSCPSNGLPTPIELSNKLNKDKATVWFYYKPADKVALPVFTRGDGNEENYIGVHSYNADVKQFALSGPGCEQLSLLSIDSGPTNSSLSFATWTLRPINTNCLQTAGWREPVRIKVSSDAAGYARAEQAQANDDALLEENAASGKVTCDASISSPLTWIMCPIATAATAGTDFLDSIVNNILNVNGEKYFGDGKDCKDKKNCVPNQLYDVWTKLRTIAMALIVIVGLFIVIAQAAGWEVMSALTIRKALPNFVIAMLLLAAWWPIGKALILLGDVATFGIRQLIYTPFGDVAVFKLEGMSGTGGTTAVLALFGSAYLLALGIFATATFAVTAFVAVLIGCVILMLRLAVIIALQTTSAIFIPFYAIPNMKGVWSFFWNGFTKAIMLGPVLAGAIAIARVLSGVMYTSAQALGDGADEQAMKFALIVMAIILYFGVYIMMAEIISAVGGLAATLAGRINDRSRGVFDRMKNVRAKAPGDRWKDFKHGELHSNGVLFNQRGNNPFAKFSRFTGRMGERAGLGAKNNFGYGDRGRAAAALMEESHIDETIQKTGWLKAMGMNDDQATAVLGLSGGTTAGALAAIDDLRRGGMSISEAQQKQIMATIHPGLGNRKYVAAAARMMMQNKARAVQLGDVRSIDRGMNRLAEDNPYMAQMYKSSVAYFARSSGRADLGGEWNSGAVRNNAAELQAAARRKGNNVDDAEALGYATMLDGIGRIDLGALLRGHPAQVKQVIKTSKFILDNVDEGPNGEGIALRTEAVTRLLELQKGLSSGQASADVQLAINEGMKAQGVNMSDPNKYGSVADQLAAKATKNRTLLNGSKLSAMARVYDNDQPIDARYQQQGQEPK